MPVRVAPMLVTRGDVTRAGPGYSLEFKLDGQRAIAVVDGRGVRLSSRNGSSITRTYSEIVDELRTMLDGRRCVLDSEIVALDATGRPSFGRLRRRMHTQRPSVALVRASGFSDLRHQSHPMPLTAMSANLRSLQAPLN